MLRWKEEHHRHTKEGSVGRLAGKEEAEEKVIVGVTNTSYYVKRKEKEDKVRRNIYGCGWCKVFDSMIQKCCFFYDFDSTSIMFYRLEVFCWSVFSTLNTNFTEKKIKKSK